MKYILVFVLYTMVPNVAPVIGHKIFNDSNACEVAKQQVLQEHKTDPLRITAICLSEDELLNYTRT